MDRAKRVVGYLSKMKEGGIRYRTDLPDYSEVVTPTYDWTNTVYGEITEIVPKDIPVPLGKPIILTHYFDANLYHDKVTGRSVTGILHVINRTPID